MVFGDILGFGILPRGVVRRIRLDLAGGLILGEIELFLNFALAAAQLLLTRLMLERSADFGPKFLAPLLGLGDVRFELVGPFLIS